MTALAAAAHAPKQDRIRWFEAEKAVRRAHRPGFPDNDGAVRLYLAGQGDAQAMQVLLDSRKALAGADRLRRNLVLADLILQGRAPGGHTAEEGRALLTECLDHAPDSHARAVVLCTLGRYETEPSRRIEWFLRAQEADPEGLVPCAALIDSYLQAKEYRKAVAQADRFWFKLDLRPYRGQKLSPAWPTTPALIDATPQVATWGVALGQQSYQELLAHDDTLTQNNRIALQCLARMNTSVGHWAKYRRPSFFKRLSRRYQVLILVLLVIVAHHFLTVIGKGPVAFFSAPKNWPGGVPGCRLADFPAPQVRVPGISGVHILTVQRVYDITVIGSYTQ